MVWGGGKGRHLDVDLYRYRLCWYSRPFLYSFVVMFYGILHGNGFNTVKATGNIHAVRITLFQNGFTLKAVGKIHVSALLKI